MATTTYTISYGTYVAMTVTNLQSLASDTTDTFAVWQGARVDNHTSEMAMNYEIHVDLSTAASAPAGEFASYLYIVPWVYNGSAWVAGANLGTTTLPTGSEGTAVMSEPNTMKGPLPIWYKVTSQRMQGFVTVAELCGGIVPCGWSPVIRNSSGAAYRDRLCRWVPADQIRGYFVMFPIVTHWGAIKPLGSRLTSPQHYAGRWIVSRKAGETITDIANKRNHGTLLAAVTYGPSKFGGRSLSFDGSTSTSIVTLPDDPSLKPTVGLTLFAWIYPKAVDLNRRIIDNEPNSSNGYTFGMGTNANTLLVRVGSTLVNNAGMAPTNAWSFVAATYDGVNVRVFVNGCECGKTAKTGAIAYTGVTQTSFGRIFHSNAGHFNGDIDNIGILNRALTDSEISALYYQPFGDIIAPRQWVYTTVVAAAGFKAAWARNANQMIQPGVIQ